MFLSVCLLDKNLWMLYILFDFHITLSRSQTWFVRTAPSLTKFPFKIFDKWSHTMSTGLMQLAWSSYGDKKTLIHMSQQSASCLSSPSTRSGNVDKVYLWDRDLSFSIQFITTYTCIVMILTKQWPSMNLRWGSAYIGTKTKRRLQRACSFSCLLQQLLAFFYKSRWWYLWRPLLLLLMVHPDGRWRRRTWRQCCRCCEL